MQNGIPESFDPSVFRDGYRASGVLLHITSLPSRHGIGDFGPAAEAWVDALQRGGQGWWQILPIGPPDRGNSPYTPLSTFACNRLLISLERLVEEGLLSEEDLASPSFPADHVDYDKVATFKEERLSRAWRRFEAGESQHLRGDFQRFVEKHAAWLEDYALFRALKFRFEGADYVDWPAEFVRRDAAAIEAIRGELSDTMSMSRFCQFMAFRQLEQLQAYAHARHVRLFGDLPIFVSADSADVWSHPDLFELDEQRRPTQVAGVPPDYFSETGQLWGNPVYNWAALRRSGYRWWCERLRALMQHHDMIRLDHFRGFSAAWHIAAGSVTAETGGWVEGPGADFFHRVREALGGLPFVAEDLGTITDDVRALLAAFHLPKMSVLQFAFDGDASNAFLPHHVAENVVAYTGTHDNNTSRGWYRELAPAHRQVLREYVEQPDLQEQDVAWLLIRLAWQSKAALTIAPLQDVLNLGEEARMNVPGIAEGNWRWRFRSEQLTEELLSRLRGITEASGRLATNEATMERSA